MTLRQRIERRAERLEALADEYVERAEATDQRSEWCRRCRVNAVAYGNAAEALRRDLRRDLR